MRPLFAGRFKRRRGPEVTGGAVRIAIVGAGKFAARTYYPLLRSMRQVHIAAACARSETRLAPLARRYRVAAVYTDLGKMLDRERPEAVLAIVPPGSALAVAREILRRGVPLYLEKPPGLSVLETREMVELAAARSLVTCVAFNRRYCAVVREAKSRLAEAGGIQSVLVEFHKDKPAGGAGDDLVLDIIHMVDLLRDLGGEVEEVTAASGARAASGRSSPAYHALLRFESGAAGVLAAFRTGGARRERIEIHGSGISAEIFPPEQAILLRAGAEKPEVLKGKLLAGSDDVLETYGFADEVRCFLGAVRGGARPPTELSDAVRTMELIERIRESARAARPTKPPLHAAAVAAAGGVTRDAAVSSSQEAARPSTRAVWTAGQAPRVALLLHPEIGGLVLSPPQRAKLAEFADIVDAAGEIGRREAARLLVDADGAITSWKSPRLTGEMAVSARRLRIIAHAAGSVKSFVDGAFFDRGVAIVNAASAIAPSVGEMALALTLAGLRSLHRYDREVRRGDFRKASLGAPADSRGLFGKRVGLVGFGRTAREFVRLLAPFACEILVFDPYSDPTRLAASGLQAASLEELLATSDVVSLHAAYTQDTHHLLDATRLALLKDGALLVNTARGALLDEAALAAVLRTGRISAALDVTVVEPLPSGADLTTLPNVILTPHIAGPTFDRLPELGRAAVEDLRLFFSGSAPHNLVTAEMLATMA